MDEISKQLSHLSSEKRALLVSRARNGGIDTRILLAEPIAIIGMGCRFAGGADDPDALWRLLRDGKDAISEVPSDRWDADAWYDPDPETRGKLSTRWGGFLSRVSEFDAEFFGISPREASAMDPQQRLLLEVVWEALEDAGQQVAELAGSRTGVFVGSSGSDYALLQNLDPDRIDVYSGTGVAVSILAGRVSYLLDFQGPSICVDTACSSSLAAVHLACQSLRTEECNLAIAGGVNLILSPLSTLPMSRMRMTARDGRCKTFDARADGFVRGEGCGAVVLQRFSDAFASGARILAVIRGSAVNQDGRTAGMTAPSVLAQQAVIRQALENAGVSPGCVTYVEAHGSGTSLGDPIEVEALAEMYGRVGTDAGPCVLGAVKSNIGHPEAAAGVAGLIKAVLSLRHEAIPPNLHFQTLNPNISLEGTRFVIPTSLVPWPTGPAHRYAAVSSFGWTGTNVHMILEDAPSEEIVAASEDQVRILPLSARSQKALGELARAWQPVLGEGGEAGVEDLCYTAAVRRSHDAHRLAIVGQTREELRKGVEAYLAGETRGGVSWGESGLEAQAGPVLVFSGQGGQWPGMGRGLLASEPVFREAVAECGKALQQEWEWDLVEELGRDWSGAGIDRIQPMLFGMGVGLSAVWRSWGVEPGYVVGHSLGEVIAAYVAGGLTLANAARVICRRSRLLARLSGRGGMVTVELGLREAEAAIGGYEKWVSAAVINSARSTVLSGERKVLEEILGQLEGKGVFCRWVQVDVASHSPQMESLREELLAELAGVGGQATKVPMWSTVLNREVAGEELGKEYWVRNLREPVRFAAAMEALGKAGYRYWVEVSPHPVLQGALREGVGGGVVVGSLRREQEERRTLLEGLGELYAGGYGVDWERAHGRQGRCVEIPKTRWQRERYWLEAGGMRKHRMLGGLGVRVSPAGESGRHYWEREMSTDEEEWGEHRVQGEAVLSGAGYVEMAWRAGQEIWGEGTYGVEGIEWKRVLGLEQVRRVQVAVSGDAWRVYSRGAEETEWIEHGGGRVVRLEGEVRGAVVELAGIRARCRERQSGTAFYEGLKGRGLEYGRSYSGVEEVWCGEGEALARVQRRGSLAGLLDSCFQTLAAVRGGGRETPVPVRAERVEIYAEPRGEMWAWARQPGDIDVVDAGGRTLIAVRGLELQTLPEGLGAIRRFFYVVRWEPRELVANPRSSPARWLIVADSTGLAQDLVAHLTARGDRCILTAGEAAATNGVMNEAAGCRGIVYLAALDSNLPDRLDACDDVLELVKTLARTAGRNAPRLWVVTRGVHLARGEAFPVSLAQAPLWGLGQVIAHEFPELNCTRVDLAGERFEDEITRLADEITANSPEDQVQLRPGARYVARLIRLDVQPPATCTIRPDGFYLITGGLGGLGLSVASWLVGQGARRLAIVSRNPPADNVRPILAAMESVGAKLSIFQADVSRIDELQRVLTALARLGPALRGIFHAAAVLDDGILLQLTPDRFRAVLQPKAGGAWNLHKLTLHEPLDHFVLFSSGVAILGNPGQANYAAANAYLDALAHHRRAQGLPALSINWGPWSDVGLATIGGRAERFAHQGLNSLTPGEGLSALQMLMARQLPQVAVLPLDIRQWRQLHPKTADAPFFEHLVQGSGRSPAEAPPKILQELRAADPTERVRILEVHIQEQTARVLRRPLQRLDRKAPLGSMGLDSLMALELRNRLEDSLVMTFPVTLIWNYRTVAALAEHLIGLLELDSSAETSAGSDELKSVLSELDRFSAEEWRAMGADLRSRRTHG